MHQKGILKHSYFGARSDSLECQKKANSEEARKKRKETYIKTGHSKGEKNSQYGTCWIRNDDTSIKIKLENLDFYLAKGYIRGRKMK